MVQQIMVVMIIGCQLLSIYKEPSQRGNGSREEGSVQLPRHEVLCAPFFRLIILPHDR